MIAMIAWREVGNRNAADVQLLEAKGVNLWCFERPSRNPLGRVVHYFAQLPDGRTVNADSDATPEQCREAQREVIGMVKAELGKARTAAHVRYFERLSKSIADLQAKP